MAELLHKQLSFAIIGAAMEVHRILCAAFLSGIKSNCL